MDEKKKGLFNIFRKSVSGSPKQASSHISISADTENERHRTPSRSPSKSKVSLPFKKSWKPRKTVRKGERFSFKMPENFPEHSPQDEEEEEEANEEEEEQQCRLVSDDEGYISRGRHHGGYDKYPKTECGDEGPAPMAVDPKEEDIPRRQTERWVSQHKGHNSRRSAGDTRDWDEERMKVARGYPSEEKMMAEAIRRSRQDFYAPPPPAPALMAPPPYFQPPPPVYPTYSPCAPYPSYAPYCPYYPYSSTYDSTRGSYTGSSSQGYSYELPRRSSGSYEDAERLAAIIGRTESLERERDYYKMKYEESKKEKGKDKRR